MPREGDDEAYWARWREWRREVLTDLVRHWDRELKSVRPHATFIPNIGVQAILDFNVEDVDGFMPFLFVDHQGRRGVEAHWAAGRNGKRMRGMLGNKPIGLITSVGP